MHHFPVKSKPHERIDLLNTASVNTYQTKIPIVVKTDETTWKLPFLRKPPSFQPTPYF